jgi:hypothetical protein
VRERRVSSLADDPDTELGCAYRAPLARERRIDARRVLLAVLIFLGLLGSYFGLRASRHNATPAAHAAR